MSPLPPAFTSSAAVPFTLDVKSRKREGVPKFIIIIYYYLPSTVLLCFVIASQLQQFSMQKIYKAKAFICSQSKLKPLKQKVFKNKCILSFLKIVFGP